MAQVNTLRSTINDRRRDVAEMHGQQNVKHTHIYIYIYIYIYSGSRVCGYGLDLAGPG